MNVVHIGLGKTGTTSLQRYVFPALEEMQPHLEYNNKTLLSLLKKLHDFGLEDYEFTELDEIWKKASVKHLVSLESLVNWNPRNWESAAELNLRAFGENTHIIITLRKTLPYLRSHYQQLIHLGNIVRPQDFFVSSKRYDEISQHIPESSLKFFDVDSFDLERLVLLYERLFKKVSVVLAEGVNQLNFLTEPFCLNDGDLRKLKKRLESSSRKNISYSAFGMWLTFKRERFLNRLGLMTLGSEELKPFRNPNPDFRVGNKKIQQVKGVIKRSYLLRRAYLLFMLKRRQYFSWRGFIQNIVDKFFYYQPYRLPNSIYINYELVEKNDRFVEKFRRVGDND